LVSIRDGKFNPKTKAFHEFDDIAINKTARSRYNRKSHTGVNPNSGTIYKNFEA
jgi:hypothetical protein